MRVAPDVVSPIAVGLALAITVTACRQAQGPPVVAPDALADSADQVMFGTVANLTDRGVLKGQIRADTGYFFDDNTRLEGRVVQVTFFTEIGAKSGVLTSREGTYNERTGNMQARGNVVVVSEDQRRLTTSVLNFDQARNEISSDSAFTLTDSAQRRLDGIGFVSDPNMNNMRCLRACSGTAGSVNLIQTQPSPAPAAHPPAAARPPAATGRVPADSTRSSRFPADTPRRKTIQLP
jgi:LPS export ABC transporter protein LptC